MATWITDANNNQCSVEYWGSREGAQKALDSLKGCSDCSDCSRCSHCSRCSGCSGCSGCSDCSGCSGCSHCSRCYGLKDAAPVEGKAELITVPIIPDIHKVVYAAASNPDALKMDTWHTCEKKHCRAGWVVVLAGTEGRELEKRFGTLLAAMKIYDASEPNYKINPCRFFDSTEDALADMKRLAEQQ